MRGNRKAENTGMKFIVLFILGLALATFTSTTNANDGSGDKSTISKAKTELDKSEITEKENEEFQKRKFEALLTYKLQFSEKLSKKDKARLDAMIAKSRNIPGVNLGEPRVSEYSQSQIQVFRALTFMIIGLFVLGSGYLFKVLFSKP